MNIVYSDKDIAVCVKPQGVVSTDDPGGMPDLIRQELAAEMPDRKPQIHIVHRLDRQAGGVMVYALTKEAAAGLDRQITDGSFFKEYLAVVSGRPEPAEGRMDDLLYHSARENRTYVVKRERRGVREASLLYETLETAEIPEAGVFSLVKIRLLTGRTHQIRAQFASRRMPLYGDRHYGSAVKNADVALWSRRLSCRHPVTGEEMVFEELPPEVKPWSRFTVPEQ